jgi:magnesium-transporting ATPase (P-type)
VIVLNAAFAFAQEMQAERAVEALAAFLPEHARVLRDSAREEIEARLLVPGDVLLIGRDQRRAAGPVMGIPRAHLRQPGDGRVLPRAPARRLVSRGADRARQPLNYAYRQATTVAWLGIVACQVGTAFAVRTDHASLRSVGVFTNRFLLAGIAVELAFAAAVIYLPALQGVFATEALTPAQLAIVAPFPLIVWGADEIRRMLMRRYHTGRQRSSAD